jgi:hypothetical protein
MLLDQARLSAGRTGGTPPFGGPATRQAALLLTGADRTESSREQSNEPG